MSAATKWAESRKARMLVTTTQHVNMKSQTHKPPSGMVSYEDLLIAQYLDELRSSNMRHHVEEKEKPSPYTQKLPHSDYTYKFRTTQRRPNSATMVEGHRKPKIDAKFIADPNLWDPATPRNEDPEGPEKYQPIYTGKNLRSRPASAPAPMKKSRFHRPMSAASTTSYYSRRPWSSTGKRIKSQYKKQPKTIRVTAFKNGSREPFVRLAAPNIKLLLESCTDKLGLPFAARRMFLDDGIEVFDARDVSTDAEIYVSCGENYKDPYATTKRNIIVSNGAKWTLTGLMIPDEGKKKTAKPRLSKRMKTLVGRRRVRIIVYINGKCIEPVEVVADLDNMEEFLMVCTAKLDLRSHTRILYDWEGNEITSLAEIPILDECLQPGGTYVLGPVWASCGEGFSPTGTRDFIVSMREVIKSRLREARLYKRELTYLKDGEEDKIKIAIKILSMKKEEVDEVMVYTDNDIEELSRTLDQLNEKFDGLENLAKQEEAEGTNYRMRHISQMTPNMATKMVGTPGLKLKVHENGTVFSPTDFYFNMRVACKGTTKEQLMQRLLDELSSGVTANNPKNPKLALVAKKIFNKFGHEITDVMKLETDDEIWVSFGEPYICPFTYCVQVIFDVARGKDVNGEKQYVLREQLAPESILDGMENQESWEASIGFPPSYNFEPCRYDGEKDHVESLARMAELDQRGHYLQNNDNPNFVLYPELILNHKLPKAHKELWPSESQIWIISKAGYIYCKPFPQLCLAVSEQRVETQLSGQATKVGGYVVCLEKKMVGNPHQLWTFNPDATIASKAYTELLITYIGKKFGEETDDSVQPQGIKPGIRIYLLVTDPLLKKEAGLQRFALKQERFENLGQWKFTEASNQEWNKQALSWPVRADGSLNEDYDWPMEGYLLPNAPKLRKSNKKTELSGLKSLQSGHPGDLPGCPVLRGSTVPLISSYSVYHSATVQCHVQMAPLRLLVVKNGERNLSQAVPVVGPNLTNYMKDITKKPKSDRKNKRAKSQEEVPDNDGDAIELDVNLHCRDLTIRELEFSMFLDHCTSMLNLPFAGRRIFDEGGQEHFSLKTLRRDQLVYVTCGEIWTDPKLTKVEQHRRFVLSQLSQDVAKMRQYCALRNPEKYVLEIDPNLEANTPVTVNSVFWQYDKNDVELEIQTVESTKSNTEEPQVHMSAHDVSHERSEQRLNNLKWPWERLVNVNNSYDADPEAQKYSDKEMYEKYKPKPVTKVQRDVLQRFVYEDGYIALVADRNLVLGVSEPEGRVVEVQLVRRRPDDVYQLWLMRGNGEIRPRHNQQVVLTVSMPSNEPYSEDDDGRPLTFAGCRVTLQTRRTNQYGKAHQRWHYDAESGFIHGFYADLPDKEITAANKADVCTYAISGVSKIDQPGYLAEVPLQTVTDRGHIKDILVCTSCARAMRGRYKLIRLPTNKEFSCAMGNAKKLKLQQIGSFRVLNGKVDLSTHEYELTLQTWEQKLANLQEETSARVIAKEINVARTVQTCKVLAYKNGEGRLRPGEIVCGSSIEGILMQCTMRLGLNKAASRLYTEDGTLIIEIDDLIDWAIQNYRSLMADHLQRLYQGKQDEEGHQERGQGEGQDSQGEGHDDQDKEVAETDQKEAEKTAKQREYLLSQVKLPGQETILRYPVEVWISSGKPFTPPEVVESKIENRKKKRAFRSAVSMELDLEKHVLRQMKGRRLDELNPGEYKGTKNTLKPVVVEGHWEDPTPDEQDKHDTVHKLQEHLAEVRINQKEKVAKLVSIDMSKSLYRQPDMKRIMVYPNGESVERATYIWGDNLDQLLDSATMRLNLYGPAKKFYTMEGKEVLTFSEIQKDELLCVSMGKPFKHTQVSRLDVEIKANWSRAHKQYGPTATDVTVQAPDNPKVNVDPFGPPALALPLTSIDRSPSPTYAKPPRPKSAKSPSHA